MKKLRDIGIGEPGGIAFDHLHHIGWLALDWNHSWPRERGPTVFARSSERLAVSGHLLLADLYVEGYLAFTLPAMLAGFLAPVVSLTTAADFYGAAVILLALASLSATTFWKMNL